MHLKTVTTSLALATAGFFGISDAQAGRVGYTADQCWGSNPSAVIVAAGHTPVSIGTSYGQLSPAQLVGLDGLVSGTCFAETSGAVDEALRNGLVLWTDSYQNGQTVFPGNRVLPTRDHDHSDPAISFPAVAPWRSGPAGLLSDPMQAGYVSELVFQNVLPSDVTVLATNTGNGAPRVISYPVGRGKVVVTTFATGCFLSGACGESSELRALTTNLYAWALPNFTTCAAEGYTGSKLTLCRSVCETTQSSSTLTSKIRLYTAIYRETPPCAL